MRRTPAKERASLLAHDDRVISVARWLSGAGAGPVASAISTAAAAPRAPTIVVPGASTGDSEVVATHIGVVILRWWDVSRGWGPLYPVTVTVNPVMDQLFTGRDAGAKR